MNLSNKKIELVVIIFSLTICGCFPSKKVTMLKQEMISPEMRINAPTKAFLMDASIVLFPNGFSVMNDRIFGTGQRYWLDRSYTRLRSHVIPLDSVAAMTYYELKSSVGSSFSSFLLGLFGGVMTPLSIYCISCPKCCFGSCPTVYTYDGKDYELEAELFSYSISKYFQEHDLDRLNHKIQENGHYQLRVSNEALETHYINKLSLIRLDHPTGTQIFPSNTNNFISTSRLQPPIEAINSLGENILPLVSNHDDHWYRSDTMMVKMLTEGVHTDWLDLKLNIPKNTENVKMVFRLRNTLLETILFYDIVLASQGITSLEWTERINTDKSYASKFHALYKLYAGIKVLIYRNGMWIQQENISDVGPIAWKYIAVEIPVDVKQEEELLVRLQFFPDNLMIDYIAFDVDTTNTKNLHINELSPMEIYDDTGKERDDILQLIQNDDAQFLITNPGESYYLTFDIRPEEGMETTLFIQSKGYYTEWIRGEWLTTHQVDYRLNLFDVNTTISQLRQSWLENRKLIEKEFFKTRIPLKEYL